MSTKEINFVDVFCEALLSATDSKSFLNFNTNKYSIMIGKISEVKDIPPDFDKVFQENFDLYTEPKPKVKRAQYLVHIKGFDPYITDTLHANEKSVQSRNLTGNPFVICERLMETEREFDE